MAIIDEFYAFDSMQIHVKIDLDLEFQGQKFSILLCIVFYLSRRWDFSKEPQAET